MLTLYRVVFYQPIFNALIWFYNVIPGHDMAVAIILLTVAVRLLLLPLTMQMLKSQRAMQQLQPKIKALQAQFKDDKARQSKELMALYSSEKVNPLASCLPLLVQLPIFIALYQALVAGLNGQSFDVLYTVVAHPASINTIGFGFLKLSEKNIAIALLAGLSQWYQARQLVKINPSPKGIPGAKDEAMLSTMNKQMQYMMPVMTAVIGFGLPAGLVLYWLATNVLTILQQYVFLRRRPPPTPSAGVSGTVIEPS